MNKMFTIAWKDLQVAFRDRAALLLMLLAPFVLTIGFGFVTGAFQSEDEPAFERFPILVINQDESGTLGTALSDLLSGDELSEILAAEQTDDVAAAKARVDADEVAAAVIIPAGFSADLIPSPGQEPADPPSQIEIYGSAGRQVGTLVVRSIVSSFVSNVEQGVLTAQVAINQLIESQLVEPSQIVQVANEIGSRAAVNADEQAPLINVENQAGELVTGPTFDLLAFLGPGFAMLFLMYTVSLGGRTFLAEQEGGTLARLLVTPTSPMQIITGKMIGIFLTGLVQLLILFLGFRFMLQLDWGPPLPLLAVILAVVLAATGWGSLLAAFARTPGQVMTYGTGMMMLFGIMSGTFGGPSLIPVWLLPFSQLTPNYWGLNALTDLQLGGTFADIVPALLWLVATGIILIVVANYTFRRQYR